MRIAGFEKCTFLDYPGKIAAVVFTPGCVFRCPYCHNPELVQVRDKVSKELFQKNKEEEFFSFLEKRRGKLDGVCITGGEPTLHADILVFIEKVKNMGFFVKLDTNGLFPDRIASIMDAGLVDYWAMDIKHAAQKYAQAAGKNVDIVSIKKSVQLIMERAREYEFRTTVVPGIHIEEDFDDIALWIKGARAYYLQEFRDIKLLDESLRHSTRLQSIDLDGIKRHIEKYFDCMEIRR